jgi:hypothetical protein
MRRLSGPRVGQGEVVGERSSGLLLASVALASAFSSAKVMLRPFEVWRLPA